MKLSRDLDVTQKTAWYLAKRIRKTWQDNNPSCAGPVEVDESYFGGKRRNMSNAKRKAMKDTGRGAVAKTAVAGIRDRKTNKVTARVIQSTDKPTLQGFIRDNVESGSQVYRDEAAAYTGMDDYSHEVVNHSVCQYVNDMAHTNEVESFWVLLKREYHGTFHLVSSQHLHRYVNEFSGRHNDRCSDTIDIMQHMNKGLDCKHLPYKDLVADGAASEARL